MPVRGDRIGMDRRFHGGVFGRERRDVHLIRLAYPAGLSGWPACRSRFRAAIVSRIMRAIVVALARQRLAVAGSTSGRMAIWKLAITAVCAPIACKASICWAAFETRSDSKASRAIRMRAT